MSRELEAGNRYKIIENAKATVCITAITALIIILNGGVSLGYSNHTGLIPVVRRMLDPNYLPNDFNIQLRLYHHRSFAYLIAAFVKLFGEDEALIVLNVIGFILLSCSLYFLCRTMQLSRLAVFTVSSLIATNVAWVGRGLETNTFVGNREINPPTFAHAFAIFAIACLLRKRFKLTAFFVALTLLFHLQIGVALILMVSPFYLTQFKRFRVKDWLGCLGLFMLPTVFTVYDIAAMFQRGLVKLPFTRSDIDFRQAHHFELVSAEAGVWVALHLILAIVVYLFFRRQNPAVSENLFVLMTLSLLVMAMSLIHFLDYYVLNIGSIMKIQLVRMSVFIPVFGAIALIRLINYWAEKKSNLAATSANLALICLSLLLYAIPATRQGFEYSTRIRRLAELKNTWVAVCLWVKENTPTDALFMTPPGNEGFSYLSHRSNVGEFKINPDGPQYLSEWYERLRDLSGGELPNGKGFANNRLFNQAYGALSQEQLTELGKKYHARFAVLPKSSAVQSNVIFENEGYKVIELPGLMSVEN
jgi:hypothetical protein